MQKEVFESADALAQATATKIIETVIAKPNALLCLASGETPGLTLQYVVDIAKKKKIDFSAVQFVGLDEWVGIPPSNSGSCYYFLNTKLFEPLSIPKSNIHFFDSAAADLTEECDRINLVIESLDGIDLILVGIGMNGHIGFNEPGTDPHMFAHVVNLDSITKEVGQKYFSENTVLEKGICLGMARFMQARTAILLANGTKKAAIIKKSLEEKISMAVPATLIRQHAHAFVMLDSEAASLL